jgi:hypothetical protein
MFDTFKPSETSESAALLSRVCASSRTEALACAERLVAIGELYALRLRESGETETWAVDTWDAVAGEVAAALRISLAMAGSYLRYARAMRERLPQVGAVFAAGDIDYRMFQTMVYRTDLITDEQVLAAVDAQLAARAPRWPSMTRGRLAAQVDKLVYRHDRDALRRRRELVADREVSIWDSEAGMADIHGSLFTTDAHALDKRLDALAATVCDRDPRSHAQRRADALGALAAGADRLGCRCESPDCGAGRKPAAGPVVIHVLAEQASLDGMSDAPGSGIGADDLIPAELVAELAKSARLRPLLHPADAAPEPGYTPSRALADFVRGRDLTCRAPGCDRPAVCCDLDHTVPHGDGGATHASNLKCLCRIHHLLKTFWGWRDTQLPDGTVIWTLPSGHTYVTTPGSALLFPSLCASNGDLPEPDRPAPGDRCGDRTAMMPTRHRTRAQNRADAITAERHHNQQAREARRQARDALYFGGALPGTDDEPPPF